VALCHHCLVVLQIGARLRYPQHGSRPTDRSTLDDLPNFFYWTHTRDGLSQAQLESGINPMREVRAPDGSRRPALLIRSSPRKAGSSVTPWHDSYDMDSGRVRYFGDAKATHMPDPRAPKGNRAMLQLFEQQTSPDREIRARACPLLFFVTDLPGVVEFRGIGLIESVELVSQIEPRTGHAFSNFAFDCALISLAAEGEQLDWEWISVRKDPSLATRETLLAAPEAWRTWVEDGFASLSRVRRNVARSRVISKEAQLPAFGSVEDSVLEEIYGFYSDEGNRRKARFEALAELVAEFVIGEANGRYQPGWITRGAGDHGVDFVGRLDVGTGFSKTSLVVLGQAKCEAPTSATSGRDIARTVARLRRGWIGCYVTTGTFSPSTQAEIVEDRYPLVLIPGGKVAEAVRTIALRDGISVSQLLKRVDEGYEDRLRDRDPEQVLVL